MVTTKIGDGSDLRFSEPFDRDFAMRWYLANVAECEVEQRELDLKAEQRSKLIEAERNALDARVDADLVYLRIHQLTGQIERLYSRFTQASQNAKLIEGIKIPEAVKAEDKDAVLNQARRLKQLRQEIAELERAAETARATAIEVMGDDLPQSWTFNIKPLEKLAGQRRAAAVTEAGKAAATLETFQAVHKDMMSPLDAARKRLSYAHEAVVAAALDEVSSS